MTDDLRAYLKAKLKELDDLKADPGRNGVTKLGCIRLQIEIMRVMGGDGTDFDKLTHSERAKMLREAAEAEEEAAKEARH